MEQDYFPNKRQKLGLLHTDVSFRFPTLRTIGAGGAKKQGNLETSERTGIK